MSSGLGASDDVNAATQDGAGFYQWFTGSGAICMHGLSASTLAWIPRDHG
jgi:hypothetical protein